MNIEFSYDFFIKLGYVDVFVFYSTKAIIFAWAETCNELSSRNN